MRIGLEHLPNVSMRVTSNIKSDRARITEEDISSYTRVANLKKTTDDETNLTDNPGVCRVG